MASVHNQLIQKRKTQKRKDKEEAKTGLGNNLDLSFSTNFILVRLWARAAPRATGGGVGGTGGILVRLARAGGAVGKAATGASFATTALLARGAAAGPGGASALERPVRRGAEILVGLLRKLALGRSAPGALPGRGLFGALGGNVGRAAVRNSGVRKLDHLGPLQRRGGLSSRSASLSALPASASRAPFLASGRFSFASARQFLVEGVLRRVTNSQAAVLRRLAARNLFSGQSSAPFLALVGVSLASGSGILTKHDEVECVCGEIRRAAGKVQQAFVRGNEGEESELGGGEGDARPRPLSLSDLELGGVLAKGCNAVVVAARWAGGKWGQVSRAFEGVEAPVETTSAGWKSEKNDHPLAVKMMFNYEAESNAAAIIDAMHRWGSAALSRIFFVMGIFGPFSQI